MERGVTLIRAGSYGEGRYPLIERGVTLIRAGSYGEGWGRKCCYYLDDIE